MRDTGSGLGGGALSPCSLSHCLARAPELLPLATKVGVPKGGRAGECVWELLLSFPWEPLCSPVGGSSSDVAGDGSHCPDNSDHDHDYIPTVPTLSQHCYKHFTHSNSCKLRHNPEICMHYCSYFMEEETRYREAKHP